MRFLSYISILYVAAAADVENKPIDLDNGLFGHEVTGIAAIINVGLAILRILITKIRQ